MHKYVEVKFSDLPKKDYAKAKFIVDNLTTDQYVINVIVDDINEFTKFINILASERSLYFIIKKAEIGSTYSILNNGYIKNKFTFEKEIEKFTM